MKRSAEKTCNAHIAQALFEYLVSLLVTGTFLSSLLKQIGISDALTGIISSIISLACGIQVFSTLLIKPGRSIRKTMILLLGSSEAMFGLLYLLPFLKTGIEVKAALFAILIISAYLIHNFAQPVSYQWLMSFVNEGGRGRYCAKMEIISLIGGMVFTLCMSKIVDRFNSSGHAQTGMMICFFVILLMAILDIAMLSVAQDASIIIEDKQRLSEIPQFLIKNRPFRKLLLLNILWNAALYISTPYYGTYLIGDLGYSLTMVSVVGILSSISRIIFSPFIGRYADSRSYRSSLAMCISIAMIGFALNIFLRPETRWLYVIQQILYAVSMAGINNGITNITYDYVDTAHFAGALGIKNAISGIAGFLVSLLGSVIVSRVQSNNNTVFGMQVYAQQILSLIAFILSTLCVICILKGIPRKE